MRRMLSLLALLTCFTTTVLAANTITGSARNQSRGYPAAGDEVILVRLDRGMPEEARAKTDLRGAFALHVQYPDQPYLVRVVHQNVNYDQRASAGDKLSIQVFDAAFRVPGITGSIEILRAGTNGRFLHVSDMYEIRNESAPPLTQAGAQTFEVYLPANANIDSVLAAGPGEIGGMISAAPVPGEPGHYTVNFPLRPGATKFAFNYDLPYDGHAAFRTRLAYPVQQLAVMVPRTMKFSSRSPAFRVLEAGNRNYQVQSASQLNAGDGPGFEVSGSGALPPIRDQVKTQAPSQPIPANSTAPMASPALPPSLAHDDSPPAKPASSSLWLVLGSTVLLAACGVLVWQVRKKRMAPAPNAVAVVGTQTPWSTTFLDGLQEELFQLEADRTRGALSQEEYASAKHALEETYNRAVARRLAS